MRFFVQIDGIYALYDPVSQEWKGMIRNVKDKVVDVIIADFTINSKRFEVADFPMPMEAALVSLVITRSIENIFQVMTF